MARGLPDYYIPVNQVSVKTIDMSAVILAVKGIPLLDGRGRPFYMYVANGVLNDWTATLAGNAAITVNDTTQPELGQYSVLVNGGTLGGGGNIQVWRQYMIYYQARMGLELGMSVVYMNQTINIEMYYETDLHAYTGRVIWDPNARTLKVNTPSGAQTFDSLAPLFSPSSWMTIKLVCDFSTGYYSRFLFNLYEYDLSGYAMATGAASAPGLYQPSYYAYPKDAIWAKSRIGHIVLTTDEP